MRLKTIPKAFEFTNSRRSLITLGAGVRLHPSSHQIQLEATNGSYSTDADLYAKTWVANPTSVKQWVGFDVDSTTHKDYAGTPITSLGFRLSDGTDEYWWNGAAWEVNTSDWNTEAEVSVNIGDFPVTERKIQVVVNLVTTDSAYTPIVRAVYVAYTSDVEFQEDIARSLIRLLRSSIRGISDYVIQMAATSATIDLDNDFPLEMPYNISGVDSVFDHTNDPGHDTDLFQSYNPTTKVITLSSSIAAGDSVWIKLVWEPEVALSTDREYTELSKVPSVQIMSIRVVDEIEIDRPFGVRNKATGTAVIFQNTRQRSYEMSINLSTGLSRDQQRLADELTHFFVSNRQLVALGVDEKYDMYPTARYSTTTVQTMNGVYSGSLKMRVDNTLYYPHEAESAYLVERLVIAGNMDVTIE